jgi:hypothetical protein
MTNDIAKPDRSAPMRVTGRLKRALDSMIWEGLTRDQAAEAAGLTRHALYCALRKPHVLMHFRGELGTLRESTRAKNFHRLDGIAETSGNDMARVAAIKTMEAISDEQTNNRGSSASPGVTIRIINQVAALPSAVVDVTPMAPLEHQPAPCDEHGAPIFQPRPRF